MIRAISLNFDVDTETGDVTNVKCQVEGQVKRKTTTKKKSEVEEPYSVIERLETKLSLNNKAISELGIEPGDRVDVIYEKVKGVLKPFVQVGGEKGNKLLSELGWKLRSRVGIPGLTKDAPKNIITKIGGIIADESWRKYIYWNVETPEKIRNI